MNYFAKCYIEEMEQMSLSEAKVYLATKVSPTSQSYDEVAVWLEFRVDSEQAVREAGSAASTKEALLMAKSANIIARKQLRWAIYAALIAIIGLIIATQEAIISSVSMLIN